MSETYIKSIEIKEVRHLKNIAIPISEDQAKNLIITGKNGSGKTSVLEAICEHLEYVVSDIYQIESNLRRSLSNSEKQLNQIDELDSQSKWLHKSAIRQYNEQLKNWTQGATLDISTVVQLREKYNSGNYILAYYKADRIMSTETYKNIEKVDLKQVYSLNDKPGGKLTKYMVDLKARQAFSEDNSDDKKSIEKWFENFESILKQIFNDNTVKLDFDKKTFQFVIKQQGKNDFDFNTLSSGYAAIFDIIGDLIIRMEAQTQVRNTFDMEGIVLIDEIETHLHIELQKKILGILSSMFPNIQFIVTTHSPYILNSISNVKIFDLEKKTELDDLTGYSVETLGEGYFGEDGYAEMLKNELYRYEELCGDFDITDEERIERAEIRNKWKNRKYPVESELYQMFLEIEEKRKTND